MSWKTYKRIDVINLAIVKIRIKTAASSDKFHLSALNFNVMKLLLAVTVLLVSYEIARSTQGPPVSKEDAETMLQVFQTIIAKAENEVLENDIRENDFDESEAEAEVAATTSTASPPSDRPEQVNCVRYAGFRGCWSCTKGGTMPEAPVITCYIGPMNSTWDHPAMHWQ